MMNSFVLASEQNLSIGWGKAFLYLMQQAKGEAMPFSISIEMDASGQPSEDSRIRYALDEVLHSLEEDQCQTVANTIFPENLWRRDYPPQLMYDRYMRLLPRLRKKYAANRNGLYFQRMIEFDSQRPVNQLDHVINTYRAENHRRSALQVSLFDPYHDHTNQRQRGFPCLQYVTFSPFGRGELAVTGFYALQYHVEKAYGNYLGLCRLGQFMAHELGLRFARMTCVAAVAKLGNPSKSDLMPLKLIVEAALADKSPNEQ